MRPATSAKRVVECAAGRAFDTECAASRTLDAVLKGDRVLFRQHLEVRAGHLAEPPVVDAARLRSDDGLVVAADAGFGVVQAGWHCCSPASGQGSGASLAVTLKPDPIMIQYGGTAKVTANGRPSQGGEYLDWTVSGVTLTNPPAFADQPTCDGAGSCANSLKSPGLTLGSQGFAPKVCGTATANVTYLCKETKQKVTGSAEIQQGCGGKSAAACSAFCAQQSIQGMCGTPCDLSGGSHGPFTDGACWRVQVNGTWYCYWDQRVPGGPGYDALCCPNRCWGSSFTEWGQGDGKYLCTVAENCTNPAFGGPDKKGNPGSVCVRIDGPGD